MRFFRVTSYDIKPTPSALVRAFALNVAQQVTTQNLIIMNGRGLDPSEFELEERIQTALMTSHVQDLPTFEGPKYIVPTSVPGSYCLCHSR